MVGNGQRKQISVSNKSNHSDHDSDHQETGNSDLYALRVLALKDLLLEKKTLTRAEIQQEIDNMDARSSADGARVVARAWVDPEFKVRLLSNPKDAVAELGYTLSYDQELVVVENADNLHHLVVCTLCSCYPSSLLGRPPDWYKSLAYRSRAVKDPRGVIAEFGLQLTDEVEVRVLDSTADVRYMVLPLRPSDTQSLTEQELAELVSRDSLIGVGNPRSDRSYTSST